MSQKLVSLFLSLTFLLGQISYAMPSYGVMNLSSGRRTDNLSIFLNGFRISSSGNIEFFYSSDSPNVEKSIQIDKNSFEFKKILENFFSAIAIPQRDWWVNLNIFIDPEYASGIGLNHTYLGKVLLESDLKMKELAMEKMSGDDALMEMLQDRGGDISKVRFWIEPDRIKVIEDGTGVYIKEARLRVKVECSDEKVQRYLTKKICPYLVDRINRGKEFKKLRAAYRSLILAKEYKEKFLGRVEEIDKTVDSYALPRFSGVKVNVRDYLCRFTALYAEGLRNENIAKVYSGGFSGVGINPSVMSGDVEKVLKNNPNNVDKAKIGFVDGSFEPKQRQLNKRDGIMDKSIEKNTLEEERTIEFLLFKSLLNLGLGLALAGILLYTGLNETEGRFYATLISLLGGVFGFISIVGLIRLERAQKERDVLFEKGGQDSNISLAKKNERGMTNQELLVTMAILGILSLFLLGLVYVGKDTFLYVFSFLNWVIIAGVMAGTVRAYLISKRKIVPKEAKLYGDLLSQILHKISNLEQEYLKPGKSSSEKENLQFSIEEMWGKFWSAFLDEVAIKDRAKKVAAMKYITHVVGQNYFDYSLRSEDDLASVYGDRDFANNAIVVRTIDLLKEHFGRDGVMERKRKELYDIMDQSIHSALAREREYIAYGKKLFPLVMLAIIPVLFIPNISLATISQTLGQSNDIFGWLLAAVGVVGIMGGMNKVRDRIRRDREERLFRDKVLKKMEILKDDVIGEISKILSDKDKMTKFADEFAKLWEKEGFQEKAILLAQLIKEANLVHIKAGKDKTFGERMGIILEMSKVGEMTDNRKLSDLLSRTIKNNPDANLQRPEVINKHGGIDLNHIVVY